jgi:hypothetical protein
MNGDYILTVQDEVGSNDSGGFSIVDGIDPTLNPIPTETAQASSGSSNSPVLLFVLIGVVVFIVLIGVVGGIACLVHRRKRMRNGTPEETGHALPSSTAQAAGPPIALSETAPVPRLVQNYDPPLPPGPPIDNDLPKLPLYA